MNDTPLRRIPSVDSLLADAAANGLVLRFGREAFLKECRAALDDLRSEILADKLRTPVEEALSRENLFHRIGILTPYPSSYNNRNHVRRRT